RTFPRSECIRFMMHWARSDSCAPPPRARSARATAFANRVAEGRGSIIGSKDGPSRGTALWTTPELTPEATRSPHGSQRPSRTHGSRRREFASEGSRGRRDGHPERASLAGRAGDCDPAPMGLDDQAGDVEAETQTACAHFA